MGLTKSEKHNRMLNNTFDFYRNHQNNLPSVHLYSRYLEIAEEKLNITKDEARNKYGIFTVKQWEEVLNLGWNSKN